MRYTDNSQKLKIDLQSGLQRLNANQIEHLARWRDAKKPLESRLSNLQEVASSVHRELDAASGPAIAALAGEQPARPGANQPQQPPKPSACW
jgi:hypothetical protein